MDKRALVWACAAMAAAAGPPATGPATAEAARFGERTLQYRSHGRDVRVLQRHLTRLGIPTSVDGYFGRRTRSSVRRYEQRHDLRVDGRVPPAQARHLRRRAQEARELRRREQPAPAAGGQAPAKPQTTSGRTARLSTDGRTALAPESAPEAVKQAIAAANRIVDKPYRYGGGHGSFEDSGYDCSGAVSYVLHGANLLSRPRDSSGFERYGAAGRGEWITIYANAGHAYVVVAGLRFDTSGRGESGPRWRTEPRSGRGYVVRHPRRY